MLLAPLADVHRAVLISQASHAWLAWQLADHWGNRRVARPAPRSEVLAAVLLQPSGFHESEAGPALDPAARPLTLADLPDAALVACWRSSLQRLAFCCRYAALLTAAHLQAVAASRSRLKPNAELDQFLAEATAAAKRWQEELVSDARYQPFLVGAPWEANLRLLAACLQIASSLCNGTREPLEVAVSDADGEPLAVLLTWLDQRTLRVHPWPFGGERVRVRCEGRLLAGPALGSQAELGGEGRRLEWSLQRSSARS